MPQAVTAIFAAIGIKVTGIVASVIAAVGTTVAVNFISGLFRPGPPKPDSTEREVRSAKPARVYALGGPRRLWGASMLFTNGENGSAVDVWAFCEGPINAVLVVYLNDDQITITDGFVDELSDGAFGISGSSGEPGAKAGYNLGAYPETAHAAVVAEVPSEWTSLHRGDGIVSGYLIKRRIKSEDFLDIFPQGDNVSMSLVVEGQFCHDPRDPGSDPDDPSTWPYSDNAVLCHLWFLMVYKGFDYAEKIAPVEQMWIDAADIADEAVSLSAGGSEARYRAAVVFAADADPSAVEDELRATYDGWTAPDENGCIRVYAGQLYEPTVTITSSQIIEYQIRRNVPDEDRINEVIVRTFSADHDYQDVECESWRDEDDILAHGLHNAPRTFQVPSYTQGRRLAKRMVARPNAPTRGMVRASRSALAAIRERYVELVIEEAGNEIFSGTVEIVGGERDYETGGFSFEFIEIDPNVDAWNPATEDGEPAPSAGKVYLAPLAAPTIDTATVVLDGATARIEVVADDPGVDGLTWFSRWRVDGDSSWAVQEHEPDDLTFLVGPVPTGTIEVSIAYSSNGQTSPWSATEEVIVEDEIILDGGEP